MEWLAAGDRVGLPSPALAAVSEAEASEEMPASHVTPAALVSGPLLMDGDSRTRPHKTLHARTHTRLRMCTWTNTRMLPKMTILGGLGTCPLTVDSCRTVMLESLHTGLCKCISFTGN